MADQAEKMVALKKAYAEIILNTAKEAASRVMASERKALRIQHDLRNTKDEALQMLLRLKQMMDAKTTEAEATSLGQQKRIKELDAQLNEAEGVIIDLREDLRKAYDRLEEAKSSHMKQSNEPIDNEHTHNSEDTAHEKKLDTIKQFRSPAQCGTCCIPKETAATSSPHLNNLFVDNPKLASMIIGSKEPELYRNGYTHRIRAIERNLQDEKDLPEDEPAQEICTKKELIIKDDEQNLGKCDPSSINTDTENLNGAESVTKDQPVKTRILPKSSVRSTESNPKLSKFGEGEKQREINEQTVCILRRSIRKRKVRCLDDISSLFKSRAALTHCKKYNSCSDGVKSDEHQYKSESMDDLNQIIAPITPSTNASEKPKDDESSGPLSIDLIKNTELVNEASGVSGSNFSAGGGATSGTDKNRLLKYTFSRKRKKNITSKSDNHSSLVKSFLTGKVEKPNVIEDPSSDGPNLVEVACQLISLSGGT